MALWSAFDWTGCCWACFQTMTCTNRSTSSQLQPGIVQYVHTYTHIHLARTLRGYSKPRLQTERGGKRTLELGSDDCSGGKVGKLSSPCWQIIFLTEKKAKGQRVLFWLLKIGKCLHELLKVKLLSLLNSHTMLVNYFVIIVETILCMFSFLWWVR